MRIAFNAVDSFPREVLDRNAELCALRQLPSVKRDGAAPPLAVVGGGPSLVNQVGNLRGWDGEIWAINGAFNWCRDRGIETTFYSIDASQIIAQNAHGATKAILANVCHPDVFDAVGNRAEVFTIGSFPNGSTTASTAPMIAALRGHPSVTFFGCESSFWNREHAYAEYQNPSRLLVKCGPDEYLTTPQLIMQAEYLCEVAHGVPGFVKVRGGGFLAALIEYGDYDVLRVSKDLAESVNGN